MYRVSSAGVIFRSELFNRDRTVFSAGYRYCSSVPMYKSMPMMNKNVDISAPIVGRLASGESLEEVGSGAANGGATASRQTDTPTWIELKKWKKEMEAVELANVSIYQVNFLVVT